MRPKVSRSLSISIESPFTGFNEHGITPRAPTNFDWQWETWVRDIADSVVYRGVFHVRRGPISALLILLVKTGH